MWARIFGRGGIVTRSMVERALQDVWRELRRAGLDTPALQRVRIERPWLLLNERTGYYQPGGAGVIGIPAVSYGRRYEYRRLAPWTSVRDILRHEYAHALADHHPEVVARPEFVAAFGAPYDTEHSAGPYAFHAHVSEYAASQPGEDFAETVMLYLRVGGRLEVGQRRPALQRKLEFVSHIPRWLQEPARPSEPVRHARGL
jgi:hypothetical protein